MTAADRQELIDKLNAVTDRFKGHKLTPQLQRSLTYAITGALIEFDRKHDLTMPIPSGWTAAMEREKYPYRNTVPHDAPDDAEMWCRGWDVGPLKVSGTRIDFELIPRDPEWRY